MAEKFDDSNESNYILKTNKRGFTKRHEIFFYSCVRRYYNILDRATKETETKRMWIVIGDGHKRYRKFETQADAIRYFRKLKKFARMRVQSVNSKEFVKMVSTFMLMEERGVNINSVDEVETPETNSNIDESQNFEDQYSQYDAVEEEVVDSNDVNYHEEIDKVLSEQEGDSFIGSTSEIDQNNNSVQVEDEDNDDEEVTYVKTEEIPIIYQDTTKTIEPKIQNLPANNATNENVETTTLILEKRSYLKANPFLFDKEKYEEKKGFIYFYDLLKFLIVFVMIFFAISSIWYYSKWSTNALNNIGVDFNIYKDASPENWKPIYDFIHLPEYIEASRLSITEWSGIAVSNEMLLVLVTMSGIGIFFSVLVLSTKRGTVFSFLTLIINFAILIVVITLFTTIFSQVNIVLQIFKGVRSKPFIDTNTVLKAIQEILEKITGKLISPPTFF